MRAAIVSASVLAADSNWSVEHFLGNPTRHAQKVAQAEDWVKRANARLSNAKAAQAADAANTARMIAEGKITPIGGFDAGPLAQ